MSSCRTAWARARSWAAHVAGDSLLAVHTSRISSTAQRRLTAVGRVASRPSAASVSAARKAAGSAAFAAAEARAASASPPAAVTPIAGAPRTVMSVMRAATSCQVWQCTYRSSWGSASWSMSTTSSARVSTVRTRRREASAGTPRCTFCAATSERPAAQVPWSQEARYLACSSVSVSQSTSMLSSLSRAISSSMSLGTT